MKSLMPGLAHMQYSYTNPSSLQINWRSDAEVMHEFTATQATRIVAHFATISIRVKRAVLGAP